MTITDRGRPVAQLTPLPTSRLDELLAAGLVIPATRDPQDLPDPVVVPGLDPDAVLNDLLAERYEDGLAAAARARGLVVVQPE